MNSQQLCERAGTTYRQLDHWVRLGYLHPTQEARRGARGTGSGYQRDFPDTEVRVACTMGRLVAAGLTPAAAHQVARGQQQIAPGVVVVVVPMELVA